MFKLLLAPQWKKYAEKLKNLGIHASSPKTTSFKDISMLVIIDVLHHHKLQHYLKAMRKNTLDPAVMLKYCVFIHLTLQEHPRLHQCKVIDFLSYLLQQSSALIADYASLQAKEETGHCTKSACNRSISTREDEVICKQVLLLSAIVRPYIGYLMKIISNSNTYQEWQKKKQHFEKHEAWMMINLLKTITSVTNQFTMIGRYYIRSYGYLVVLLTKALSRDIRMYIEATGRYVTTKNCILSCSSSINAEHKMEIEEFIKMLEEITKLNDQLLGVYLGKYFFEQLQDIPEPKWINTNSTQFDTIFKLRKVLTGNPLNLPPKAAKSLQKGEKEIKAKIG